MAYEEYDLETLGRMAKAHYEKGGQHYMACGLYLKEAKARVLKIKGETWPGWLFHNWPIGRSRADDLIRVAEGKTSLEELAKASSARAAKSYAAKATAAAADSYRCNGKSAEKTQQKQRVDPVKAARPTPSDPRAKLLQALIAVLKHQPIEVLERIYQEITQ